MHARRPTALLWMVSSLMLALVACGGGGDGSATSTSQATQSTGESTTSTTTIAGWAAARSGDAVCDLVESADPDAALGVAVTRPLRAHPVNSQCTLTIAGGQVIVRLLTPDTFPDMTAAEAFTEEIDRLNRQHTEVVGDPGLGTSSAFLSHDEEKELVIVAVGEEVFEVQAGWHEVAQDDLAALAAALLDTLGS